MRRTWRNRKIMLIVMIMMSESLDVAVKSCGEALMNSADYLKCLKVVLEARLMRDGHVEMPAGDSAVEQVTDIQRALELARRYLIPDTASDPSTNSVV